jgi:hypothetical protein
MAAAASLSALPKSKSSNAAPTTTPAPIPSASAHQQAEDYLQAADNSDFAHPDHVITERNYSGFEDLVIVCCHAIYIPNAESHDFPLYSPQDERNWHLAPFQKSSQETGKPGEHVTFMQHAQVGIDALTINPTNADLEKNILVFSGGPTKQDKTDMSEARSYYHAALAEELAQGHLGGGRTHSLFARGRILLEEHATDSLQNLLLSILLFRRTTGHYPRQIRLITHAFKSKRFLELHAPALRWPASRIQVQGIDPVMSSTDLESTLKGEEEFGYALWKEDPLGGREKLSGKRRQRGWDESVIGELLEGLEEGVRQLVEGKVPDKVPWGNERTSEVEV